MILASLSLLFSLAFLFLHPLLSQSHCTSPVSPILTSNCQASLSIRHSLIESSSVVTVEGRGGRTCRYVEHNCWKGACSALTHYGNRIWIGRGGNSINWAGCEFISTSQFNKIGEKTYSFSNCSLSSSFSFLYVTPILYLVRERMSLYVWSVCFNINSIDLLTNFRLSSLMCSIAARMVMKRSSLVCDLEGLVFNSRCSYLNMRSDLNFMTSKDYDMAELNNIVLK